jgi:hypothetical protein
LCRLPRSLDRDLRLGHKLVDVVVVAVVHAVDVAYRSYAPTHGNLSASRDESRNTNKVLRFLASLSEHEAELSLILA